MALWKFSKLDMWQIRLRVTGSSHSAETEELGTEDPSDVSVPLCTGSSRHHPRWHWVLMRCDNQLSRPRRGCARSWRHLFPECCVRAQRFLCSDGISMFLTNAHILPCSYCLHGLEEPAGITLQLLEKRHCNIHVCSERAFGFGQLHSLQFSENITGQGA